MVRVPTAKVGDAWSVTFNGIDFINKLKGFDQMFKAELEGVTENLLKGAVTRGRKTLDQAETTWGRARMRGERFGVRFKPYGNSAGRNRTGFMMSALDWKIERSTTTSSGFFGKVGWFPENTKGKDQYIRKQEYGFPNFSRFDRARTAATGVASFYDASSPRHTKGAKALPAMRKSLKDRAPSGYQAAWNEAVKQWYSAGFKTSPGSFKAARNRYARFGRV